MDGTCFALGIAANRVARWGHKRRMSNTYEFGYRLPRFRADFHFLLQTEGPQSHVANAQCVDISEEGMAAQVPEKLAVGATVTLILTLPGTTRPLRIPARVITQQEEDHGLIFMFSSEAEREEVQRYVASLHSSTVRLPPRPR